MACLEASGPPAQQPEGRSVWRTEQLHHPSVVPLLKVDLDEVRVVTLGDEHSEDRVAVLAHTASHPECNRAVLFSLPVGGGGSARIADRSVLEASGC